MLSDFDLSKQSGEPGGAPAGIKQSGPNGVSASVAYWILTDDPRLSWSTRAPASPTFARTRLSARKVRPI
jgi:hypothetical protein